MPVEESTSVPDSVPSDFYPSVEPSSLSSPIITDLHTEEPTVPSDIPTYLPNLVLHSEPNIVSTSGEPFSLTYTIPNKLPS